MYADRSGSDKLGYRLIFGLSDIRCISSLKTLYPKVFALLSINYLKKREMLVPNKITSLNTSRR